MAEITLDFLGQRIAQIQNEQRTIRLQLDLIRGQLGDAVTKQDLAHFLDVIADRFSASDQLAEARIAPLEVRTSGIEAGLDQVARSIQRIETMLVAIVAKIP